MNDRSPEHYNCTPHWENAASPMRGWISQFGFFQFLTGGGREGAEAFVVPRHTVVGGRWGGGCVCGGVSVGGWKGVRWGWMVGVRERVGVGVRVGVRRVSEWVRVGARVGVRLRGRRVGGWKRVRWVRFRGGCDRCHGVKRPLQCEVEVSVGSACVTTGCAITVEGEIAPCAAPWTSSWSGSTTRVVSGRTSVRNMPLKPTNQPPNQKTNKLTN